MKDLKKRRYKTDVEQIGKSCNIFIEVFGLLGFHENDIIIDTSISANLIVVPRTLFDFMRNENYFTIDSSF